MIGTMVELYNIFFVPFIYPAIQEYQNRLQQEEQKRLVALKEESK